MQCEKDEQESMKRTGGGGGGGEEVQHRDMRINLSFPFPVYSGNYNFSVTTLCSLKILNHPHPLVHHQGLLALIYTLCYDVCILKFVFFL